MPNAARSSDSQSLVLRLSVPAEGRLRNLAADLARKVAEYLGSDAPEAESAAATLERLAARVAPAGAHGDITFEFREVDHELLIEARCCGRAQEVRCPLPA